MSRNVVYIGIAIILVVVIVALYFYNIGIEDPSKTDPDYKISAKELYNEFSRDQESATEKYAGKIIEVTGTLKDKEIISDNALDPVLEVSKPKLILETSDPSGTVICIFNNVKKMGQSFPKTGEVITVRGICSGMGRNVLLENCVLVGS